MLDVFSPVSTEILLNIFGYLDVHNLCNLRLTCKRFKDVIDTWAYPLLLKDKSQLLVTNQEHDGFSKRCRRRLATIEKILISKNWEQGYYKEKCFMSLYGREIFMPWLHLTKEHLWCSRASHIFQFKRTNKSLVSRPVSIVLGSSTNDVTKYNIKNNNLVAGRRDGSIILWSVKEERIILESWGCHDSDINCVDISFEGQTIVSGSRDNSVKIWKVKENLEETACEELRDTIWTVSLSNLNKKLAVGTSQNISHQALLIYDLERFPERDGLSCEEYTSRGHGVLDVKWDGSHNIWSCGYDTYLRRWDLRTGKCEQSFEDVCGDVLYCFDIDCYNTAITGSQMHSRLSLWDIRQKKCVQLYFLRKNHSPVYSVAFDAEHLFVAIDKSLHLLDFHSRTENPNDYKYFLNYRHSSN